MTAMFGPCYVMQPPKMRRNQCRRDHFCCGKTVLHLALTWVLLMTVIVLKKAAIVDGALERTTCARFVGQYRDCTCSVMYRDVEERCCNRYTCFQPRMRSENFTCPTSVIVLESEDGNKETLHQKRVRQRQKI